MIASAAPMQKATVAEPRPSAQVQNVAQRGSVILPRYSMLTARRMSPSSVIVSGT